MLDNSVLSSQIRHCHCEIVIDYNQSVMFVTFNISMLNHVTNRTVH